MIFFIINIYYKKFMSDAEEIWIDIEGYNGDYQISTFGRVKSFKLDEDNGKILKRGKKKNRKKIVYLYVALCKENRRIDFSISRLVATAFIPNPDNLPFVDHIDGNPLNNYVSNLRWVKHGENMRNKDGWGNTSVLGLRYQEPKKKMPRIQGQYTNKEGKIVRKYFTINPKPRCKNAKEGEWGYCYPTRKAAEEAAKKWLKNTRDVEFPGIYVQCYKDD
jgi:hypothetical protein